MLKKNLPTPKSVCSPMFSLKYIRFTFTFRSLIYLIIIFAYGVKSAQDKYILSKWLCNWSSTIYFKDCVFPLQCSATFFQKSGNVIFMDCLFCSIFSLSLRWDVGRLFNYGLDCFNKYKTMRIFPFFSLCQFRMHYLSKECVHFIYILKCIGIELFKNLPLFFMSAE